MPICDICSKTINTGKRIANNGIKYICSNKEDLSYCLIYQNKIENKILSDLKYEYKKKLELFSKEVNCNCGTVFKTDFPMESCPPCASCPNCNKLHYEKEE